MIADRLRWQLCHNPGRCPEIHIEFDIERTCKFGLDESGKLKVMSLISLQRRIKYDEFGIGGAAAHPLE
jgi:hypothetical protein